MSEQLTEEQENVGDTYAVNICDLLAYVREPLNPVMLLLQPVLTAEVVYCEGERRPDSMSAPVKPDIPQMRWNAIYTIVRERMGIAKHVLRMYRRRGTGQTWERI